MRTLSRMKSISKLAGRDPGGTAAKTICVKRLRSTGFDPDVKLVSGICTCWNDVVSAGSATLVFMNSLGGSLESSNRASHEPNDVDVPLRMSKESVSKEWRS